MADLTLPDVGDPGPQWAYEVLDAFNLVNESTENNATSIASTSSLLSTTRSDISDRMNSVAAAKNPDTAPSGWSRASASSLGVPSSGNFLVLTMWFNSTTARAQLAMRVITGSNELWIRNMSAGTWSTWEKVNKDLEGTVDALVEASGTYPERTEGATNIFVGPTDPGNLMSAEDVWANPDVTTLDTVTAAVQDPGSDLRAAVAEASGLDSVNLSFIAPITGATFAQLGSTGLYGYRMASGAVGTVAVSGSIPRGWETATVEVFYAPASAPSADRVVRFYLQTSFLKEGVALPDGSSTNNSANLRDGLIQRFRFTTTQDVVDRAGGFNGRIGRLGQTTTDTYEGDIYLLSARLVRET